MTNNVPLICYYDGELQQNSREPVYVGGNIRADRVLKEISFKEFAIKMHKICQSQPEQTSIDIKCRYLLDQHTSIALCVEDDSSLSIIMDLHPHQCNAIAVYIENRQAHESISTTQRHIGSSSSDAGDCNGMANTPVLVNVKQITSNGLDNFRSLEIDKYSTPSKESSSAPRSNKVVLEKELEISSESTALLGNEPIGQSVEHFSKDSSVNVLHDPEVQVLKPSEENTSSSSAVQRSQGRGSIICSKPTPFSRNDTLHFKNSTNLKSWFRMRVLDPKDLFLQRWNRVFVLSCVLALALDAVFFYTPVIDYKKYCLHWDKSLEITTCLLRSLTDFIYIVHIIFQFRTGFFAPSSRVFGRGEFVEDLGVIAKRYLSSFFLIDILAVLPLPQVLILIIMPQMNGSVDVRKSDALRYIVLLQYLPRFLRIYPLYKVLLRVNPLTKTAWAGVFLNFSLYILGSHVFGAFWYFLSVERVDMCWRESCRSTSACELYSLSCGNHNSGGGVLLQTSCPIIEPNKTLFDFGIYLDALQSGIPKSSFPEKLTYCFWWGLQNIGSFGQNLKTSAYIWEVCFAVSISVFGLFFFMLLIGNVQTYLQSDTVKSEKEFRKKIQDTEQWMSRKFLPENLRQRIRQYELHIWQTTRGFDDEILFRKLPKDLKRDIKRHLSLALLMQVPMFEKMDDQFLDALCDRLKPVLYTEDNLIIQEGHPLEEMLFILSGELLSVSTHGGNTSIFESDYLKAGDFIGEELLFWAILPTSSSNPISTRTVHALKEVEAFALIGEDLKLVISQFRLQRQQLRHILRFYSLRWRTWAAYYIQLAWRQYRKRKLEKCRLEEENRIQDRIVKNVASSISLGATIYASRFAANTLRTLRRNTARKAMLRHVLGQVQKPDEPELLC